MQDWQQWFLIGLFLGAYPIIVSLIDQYLLGHWLSNQFNCLFFSNNSTGIGVC